MRAGARADGLLVLSAAWARYADDLPNIEMTRHLMRQEADAGDLIILQDHGLDRETATLYSGAAKLVPSVSTEQPTGRTCAPGL